MMFMKIRYNKDAILWYKALDINLKINFKHTAIKLLLGISFTDLSRVLNFYEIINLAYMKMKEEEIL